MEIRQLRAFLAICEAGSFSKAAASILVAQPVLSRLVRALEADVGAELFFRNGRGIVLTDAGKLLETHAREAVGAVDRASADLKALQDRPTGQVAIGLSPTVAAHMVVPLVKRFRSQFPEVSLEVMEGYGGYLLEWLNTGRLDAAIIHRTPRSSTLIVEDVLAEELCLVGSPHSGTGIDRASVSGDRLATLPLILPSAPHGMRSIVSDALARIGLSIKGRLEVSSLESTMALVEEGIGLTVLPYGTYHNLYRSRGMRYWRIENPTVIRNLVLATSTSRISTPAGRSLAKLARQEINHLVADGRWLLRPE